MEKRKKNRASKAAVGTIMFLMLASLASAIVGQRMPGLALTVFSLTGIAVALTIYFIPTLVAADRYRPDIASIAAINLLIGWLLIPWAVALAWALRPVDDPGGAPAAADDRPASAASQTRLCPFCAEPIQMAAIKCKHCGSDLLADPRDMIAR